MPVELAPLGSQGLRVPRIGCGIMSAAFYSSGDCAADEAAQLSALDALVAHCAPAPAFVDTAWIYRHPTDLHSEEIVGKAVAKHGRAAFVIATKFGSMLPPNAPSSSTETIHAQYAESVARLGCAPDLYYQHRPDLSRDVADVMLDLKEMHAKGLFKYVGLSECTSAELRRAHAVFPVTCIQMEWSLAERGIEATLLPTCRELGVGIVAYSPLARGLLTGAVKGREALDKSDRRNMMPRFADGAVESNVARFATLGDVAARKGCTPAQLCLAWLLAKFEGAVPIPGSKTTARVLENMGALDVKLSAAEVAELEAMDLKAAGDRYMAAMSTHLWERELKA
jgi:aryl-alcohol dehydrogenase-like predicted oxidoreductase